MPRAVMLLAFLFLAAAGCDSMPSMEMRPGARSIFDAFAPPSPEEAARWAIDPWDADKRYRGTILLANASFAGEPIYIQLFTTNIQDKDPGVRAAACRALALHGSPEHVPLLAARLTDEASSVRIEAARALQRVHNPAAAIDPLLTAIRAEKEQEPQVRSEAALALGQYGEARVVERLITALADDSLAVNVATQDSLRTLTGQDFGTDRAAWQNWYNSAKDPFAARAVYMYPAFHRKKKLVEYLPFVPGPPNEVSSVPAGMVPGATN